MEDQNENEDRGHEEDIGMSFGPMFPGLATMEGVGAAMSTSLAVVEKYTRPDIVTLNDPETGAAVYAAVSHERGVEVLDPDAFDGWRTQPRRRAGKATLLALTSFIAHVNRFSDADTVIFANNDRANPSLTAVLNYHRAGSDADPRFGDHRSHFAFPLSDEWKAWNALNAQPMKNTDFAAFLEDRIIDVMPRTLISLSPEAQLFVDTLGGNAKIADPAKLMEIATQLKILENSVVNQVHNLSSGEAQIEFASEHLDSAGQKLNLPTMFVIGIPVFQNGETYQVIARFRYRKNGPTVVFWYELWRTDRVFDHAFDESIVRVEAETDRPVLLGTDER